MGIVCCWENLSLPNSIPPFQLRSAFIPIGHHHRYQTKDGGVKKGVVRSKNLAAFQLSIALLYSYTGHHRYQTKGVVGSKTWVYPSFKTKVFMTSSTLFFMCSSKIPTPYMID